MNNCDLLFSLFTSSKIESFKPVVKSGYRKASGSSNRIILLWF